MRVRMRALLLVAASGVVTPSAAWSLGQPSSADFCSKENDLCRQTYACPAAPKRESENAVDPYYCQVCKKKLDSCLSIAGVSTKTARHALRKTSPGFGYTAPDHQLRDSKFGTELATRSRDRKGVATEGTDAQGEEKTPGHEKKSARDAPDPRR